MEAKGVMSFKKSTYLMPTGIERSSIRPTKYLLDLICSRGGLLGWCLQKLDCIEECV